MTTEKKRKVLITGASGSIGGEVLKMLLKRLNHFEIRVFDLDTPKNREYFDRFYNKIEVFFGDISRIEDTIEAITGVDLVIHLAAVIPPLARERADLVQSVNVEGTRNIVTNMERYAPHAFLMYASSVAVYGDRIDDPYISVEDPLAIDNGDVYAQGKIQAEKIIRESKLQWTIFRLAAIMGAGNHKVSGLAFLMPLKQLMEICTPRDTARAFVYGLNHVEELANQIFNLGGGAQALDTYGNFLAKNFEIMGLGKLDFPPHAFAEKGFHCGYYVDGDKLENILHFRRDTLIDYYAELRDKTPMLQRGATRLLAKPIKSYLLSKSEPYEAWTTKDREKMSLYFKEESL